MATLQSLDAISIFRSARSQEGAISSMPRNAPRVGLFVTCLVDLFRPSIGFAAVKLLRQAGCVVEVPPTQTCCGQPAYNSGDRADAGAIAARAIAAFEPHDYVVAPSGSCAGMIREHYPLLFADDPAMLARARALAGKTFELVSFLVDVMKLERVAAHHDGVAAYHDSCSGLRELGVRDQPRKLLAGVAGLSVRDLNLPEACCGFGGTFCVKYGAVSDKIAADKLDDASSTGADLLLAGDLGCLLHLAGKARRDGRGLAFRHVAEVLADDHATPPIGEPG
jgi:L-lactate dehydrogenase complex protein LldE